MRRIFTLIVGVWLAIIGSYLMVGKDYYIRGVKLEFGGANVFIGLLCLVIGIGIIIFALRTKSKDLEDKVNICSSCAQPYDLKNVSNMRCPECGGELEDVDGFRVDASLID